jgi:hypothetical protein
LDFFAGANAVFEASIGALSGTVDLKAAIDNYGEPLSISIGLNPNFNYYISDESIILQRSGFKRVTSWEDLLNDVSAAIRGQVAAEIEILLAGGLGWAFMSMQISDINNLLQGKDGAVAFVFESSILEKPSFIDLLLLNPRAIVNAIDSLFKSVSEFTLGRRGIVTTFPMPFIGATISRELKAGTKDHFMEQARRAVKGTLIGILKGYNADGGSSTVADLIANGLTDLLGNKIGILRNNVSVKYYEHIGEESFVAHDTYDRRLNIKSLMFDIPFGQTFTIELPPLNFDFGNKIFPVQISMGGDARPALSIQWSFRMGFGLDEDDGFFIYTFPKQGSELFVKADFTLPIPYVDAKLLYFLNLGFENFDIAFGAGIFLDIDKEHGMRETDNPNSVRYGRLTLDDIQNRVPDKKDLFVICAAGTLKSQFSLLGIVVTGLISFSF